MASNTSLVTSIPPSAPTSISLDRRDTHSDHGRVASTTAPSLALIFGTAVDSTIANITPDILPNNIFIADNSDTKENLSKQGYVPIDELNKNNNYNHDHHFHNEKNYSSNYLNHDNVLSSSTSNKFNKNFISSSNNLNRNNNNNTTNNNRSRTSNNMNTKTTMRSISVPNLCKKSSSSSIHISTGSMSTRLSAASRYKTATDNNNDDDDEHDDDDDDHVHLLSDQLKHSTVASIIESHFNPEPQKIFYEYPITTQNQHQNPQNYTSSSQSKELNTSYIAVKYPTSNNQPWYPSSSSSSSSSSQQLHLQQPDHQKERTNQLRLAATTALRIKQHLALSPEERKQTKKVRPRYGVSKSASATTISKSLKEYPFNHHHHNHEYSTHNRDDGYNNVDENNDDLTDIDKKSSEAVQRLTQENWRLFRKYERLERSIDELKGFKDYMHAGSTDRKDTSPSSSSSSIKSSGRGRGREGVSERVGIVMDHNYNPHQMNGIDGNKQANQGTAVEIHNIGRNDFTDADVVDDSGKVPWQLQIEKALLQIAIENKKLTERVSYHVTAHLCFIQLFIFLFLYLFIYLSFYLYHLFICLSMSVSF
jgi:hypothetical protein